MFSTLKTAFKIPFIRKILASVYKNDDPRLHKKVFGLDFPNPVGLAAGFDKDGKYIQELSAFGFGFIEVGTVTPLPQSGNPKPRMFRLLKDHALINRMGFNNDGVQNLSRRLKRKRPERLIIGGNIGKNKDTPNENAAMDYEKSFKELYHVVDYFAVNVSSPNTPGLRFLQQKEPLRKILQNLVDLGKKLSAQRAGEEGYSKPILLKIAPDLSDDELNDIVEVVISCALSGVIATNTTVNREGLKTDSEELTQIGAGGLSGSPLRERSTEIIKKLKEKSGGKFSIIGAGGIHSAEDAIEKLNAGADLIQVYTGFIYEGPSLVGKIKKSLLS